MARPHEPGRAAFGPSAPPSSRYRRVRCSRRRRRDAVLAVPRHAPLSTRRARRLACGQYRACDRPCRRERRRRVRRAACATHAAAGGIKGAACADRAADLERIARTDAAPCIDCAACDRARAVGARSIAECDPSHGARPCSAARARHRARSRARGADGRIDGALSGAG